MAKHKRKWKWRGGRLYHPVEPTISLSVNEAYHMIPKNEEIAAACDGVLGKYDELKDGLRGYK